MQIKLSELSTDSAGEYLRGLVFKQNRNPESLDNLTLGCYSSFVTQDNFRDLDKNSKIYETLYRYVHDCSIEGSTIEQSYTTAVENDKLIAMWYWDGDGTLLIYVKEDRTVFINYDCKKTHGWHKYS